MAVPYVEKFLINNKTYGIAEADGHFECWVGGCEIANAETMPRARAILHQYAVSQNRAERASAEQALNMADAVLIQLGDDPFYLGKFLR